MDTRIAELRNGRKWSQRELGEKVGASRDQIKNWEKGHMTIGQARSIAYVFDVSLDYLLCLTDINDLSIRRELDAAYGKLNEDGRRKVMEYARDLAQTVAYANAEGGEEDAQATG